MTDIVKTRIIRALIVLFIVFSCKWWSVSHTPFEELVVCLMVAILMWIPTHTTINIINRSDAVIGVDVEHEK